MCTHLIRRQATYYSRRVIPVDIQPTFGGKREWVYSLKTKDRGQAKRLAQDETVRVNRLIDEARGRPPADTQATVAHPPATAPQPTGVMLDPTIVDLWAAERKVADKSRDTHRAVARWFYHGSQR